MFKRRRPILDVRPCEACGSGFGAKVSNAKYCPACRPLGRVKPDRLLAYALTRLNLTKEELKEQYRQNNLRDIAKVVGREG